MDFTDSGDSLLLLLVDRDAAFSRRLEEVISGIGSWRISLRSVSDIDAAQAEIQRNPPDICLLDCRSFENLSAQLPTARKHVPVILLGDQGGTDLERKAIEAGAVDYLQKAQIKPAVLERLVRNALRWRMATSRLRESEERFRLMADSAPVLIWMAGLDRTFDYFNSSWLRFTGRELKEELGFGWTAGIHPEDRYRSLRRFAAAFAGRHPFELEFRLRRQDGAHRWLQAVGVPRFSHEEVFAGFIGSCVDITEHKNAAAQLRLMNENLEKVVDRRTRALERANVALRGALEKEHRLAANLAERNAEIAGKNEELNRAYAELKDTQSRILQQEKMAAIGQLAAGVAHEINNPIGFLSSNLGTLKKYVRRLTDFIEAQTVFIAGQHGGAQPPALAETRRRLKIDHILGDIQELIEESEDGACRVKKIVQDLKTFSRVDEAECQMANINDCIDTTINVVWNEIKYKATLKKDFGRLPLLLCHPLQLSQVFMNLLLNAVHAIERHGEIEVRTWAEGGQIHIAVADNGCGMAREIREKIFEPFFTTKRVGQGTGLGLSISYDIIKKHRGDIRVESEEGKGTTFVLTIPAAEGEAA